jgi:DNA-binding NtrC family response regulator
VLQERAVHPVGAERPVPVDVRVVAATHQDLAALVRAGTFREDLYYRLAVLPMQVPPLRERRSAIVPFFEMFLASQAQSAGRTLSLSADAAEELRHRAWPGNVRQLENVARRVALLTLGTEVRIDDLPPSLDPIAAPIEGLSDGATLRVRLDTEPWDVLMPRGGLSLPDLERRLVQEAIRVHGGNKSAAARFLGIPRHVLLYRLEKYGIDPDGLKP